MASKFKGKVFSAFALATAAMLGTPAMAESPLHTGETVQYDEAAYQKYHAGRIAVMNEKDEYARINNIQEHARFGANNSEYTGAVLGDLRHILTEPAITHGLTGMIVTDAIVDVVIKQKDQARLAADIIAGKLREGAATDENRKIVRNVMLQGLIGIYFSNKDTATEIHGMMKEFMTHADLETSAVHYMHYIGNEHVNLRDDTFATLINGLEGPYGFDPAIDMISMARKHEKYIDKLLTVFLDHAIKGTEFTRNANVMHHMMNLADEKYASIPSSLDKTLSYLSIVEEKSRELGDVEAAQDALEYSRTIKKKHFKQITPPPAPKL